MIVKKRATRPSLPACLAAPERNASVTPPTPHGLFSAGECGRISASPALWLWSCCRSLSMCCMSRRWWLWRALGLCQDDLAVPWLVKHRFCTGAPEVNAVRGCKLEVEAAGGVARRYYTAPPPPLCRCEPWKSARWLLGSYPSTALCAVQAGRPFFSFLGALAKRGHDKRGDDGTSRCGRWIGRAVGMSNGFLRDLYVLYVQSFGTRAAWHGVPAALLGSSTERWEPPISFCMHGRVAPSFFFGPLSPATSLLAPLSSHNQVLRQGGSQRSHHQISPLVAFMRSPRSACGSVDPPPLQPPPAPLSPAVR